MGCRGSVALVLDSCSGSFVFLSIVSHVSGADWRWRCGAAVAVGAAGARFWRCMCWLMASLA